MEEEPYIDQIRKARRAVFEYRVETGFQSPMDYLLLEAYNQLSQLESIEEFKKLEGYAKRLQFEGMRLKSTVTAIEKANENLGQAGEAISKLAKFIGFVADVAAKVVVKAAA